MRRTSKEPRGTLLYYTAGLSSVLQVFNPKTSCTQVSTEQELDWTLPGLQLSVPGPASVESLARPGCPVIRQRSWEPQHPEEDEEGPWARGQAGPAPGCRSLTRDGLFSASLQPSGPAAKATAQQGPGGPGEQAAPRPCLLGLSGGSATSHLWGTAKPLVSGRSPPSLSSSSWIR